jgi:PIN domain nuclease of toxin-antitoxin system
MRLLLDTNIFLWLTTDDRRLRAPARQLLTSASEIFVSSVSIWEIAIKSRIGKIKADPDDAILEMKTCGFRELFVSCVHAAAVAKLPLHHRDAFDRLLIAQAIAEHLQLVTADPRLGAYSGLVTVV